MQAEWFFDFISPYSYLQLDQVHAWRRRLEITPVPIAFGAVLNHTGTLGPAEVPGKRDLGRVVQALVTQEDHLVIQERLADLRHDVIWKRPGGVEGADLGSDLAC